MTGSTTNLKDKRIAESMFYMDLVKYNLNLFNRGARFKFLMKAEVSIKKYRKLSLEEWYILFLKYVHNFAFIAFLKFTRRFLKSFF